MSEQEELLLNLGDEVEDFSFNPNDADSFSLDTPGFREQEGLVYPALLLTNVMFMDCLHVLKQMKKPSFREFDTWVELNSGQGYQHIGSIQWTSDVALALRYLHVGVTVYYDSEQLEVVDLNDPETLMRLI